MAAFGCHPIVISSNIHTRELQIKLLTKFEERYTLARQL